MSFPRREKSKMKKHDQSDILSEGSCFFMEMQVMIRFQSVKQNEAYSAVFLTASKKVKKQC